MTRFSSATLSLETQSIMNSPSPSPTFKSKDPYSPKLLPGLNSCWHQAPRKLEHVCLGPCHLLENDNKEDPAACRRRLYSRQDHGMGEAQDCGSILSIRGVRDELPLPPFPW